MEEEVLSQEPIETNEEENLFDGITPEEVEEEEETSSDIPEEPKPFLTIKYNKEEKGLTQEEAIDYAEKGMNYDKLRDRYNAISGPIEDLARRNNMDVESFIESLNNTQLDFEVSQELEHLREDYPDTEDEVLEELARSRVEGKYSRNIIESQKAESENADARGQEAQRQIDTFLLEYPDKKDDLLNDRIDPQVFEYVKQGFTLLEAYSKWERGEMKKQSTVNDSQAKVANLNEENRKKSLGNLTNADSVQGENDFFSGFNSI